MTNVALTWWLPSGGAIPITPLTVDLIGPAQAWVLLAVLLLGVACGVLWFFTNRRAPSLPEVTSAMPFTRNCGTPGRVLLVPDGRDH